jgi:hypothetical protein
MFHVSPCTTTLHRDLRVRRERDIGHASSVTGTVLGFHVGFSTVVDLLGARGLAIYALHFDGRMRHLELVV